MSNGDQSEELNELRAAFILMDSDNDGRVTCLDIQSMLNRLGIHISEEVVFNLVRQASKSGSSLMDEKEFYQWVRRIQSLQLCHNDSAAANSVEDETLKDLLSAFKVFDRDKNGFITKDELKMAMEMIGESVTENGLNVLIKTADVDKDGRINYEEFVKILL